VKVGDLVRHTQWWPPSVGLIVKKKERRPTWTCDVWVVLFAHGLDAGTDNNLEVISESR